MNLFARPSLVVIPAFVAFVALACGGATDQDVLSTTGDNATTTSSSTSSSSGTTTSGGTSGTTTSGGTSGTTTSGGTSGAVPGCTNEGDDSNEANKVNFTGSVCGVLHPPKDTEDWAQFDRPKNSKFSLQFTGNVTLTFWDEKGNSYDLKSFPNNEGTYSIQIKYDFNKFPLSGVQLAKGDLAFPWMIQISLK